jgi:hypothetical protein
MSVGAGDGARVINEEVGVGVNIDVGVRVGVVVDVGVCVGVVVDVGVCVGVVVDVGVCVGVVVDVGVCVGVGVFVAAAAQTGRFMVVLFSVTAWFLARSLPLIVEPPSSVIEARANIFPTKVLFVPRVVDVSALHHTSHGSPPATVESEAVMIVDADLKIQTPAPLRFRVPLTWKLSAQ